MKRFVAKLSKAICMLIILCCIFSMPFISNSYAQEPSFVSLSNKSMLSILYKEFGSEWTFYQPASREKDVNCSSKAFLKHVEVFPVVAMNGDQALLLLLRKNKNAWQCVTQNSLALMREGFTLLSFSVDENRISNEDPLYVYFEFMNERHEKIALDLLLHKDYAYFSSISTSVSGAQKTHKSVVFHPYYGYTFFSEYYTNYATISLTTSYTIEEDKSFSPEDFILSECPLSIDDLMMSATCSSSVDLYLTPTLDQEAITQVSPGERIYVIHPKKEQEWTIVQHKGNLFFCLCAQMQLTDFRKK